MRLLWGYCEDTVYPFDVNAAMCFRRLKVCDCNVKVEAPGFQIPDCPRCFAQIVFAHATL